MRELIDSWLTTKALIIVIVSLLIWFPIYHEMRARKITIRLPHFRMRFPSHGKNRQSVEYVYLVTDRSGYYKIGRTKNLKQRMRALNTGNSQGVRLVGQIPTYNSPQLEKDIHRYLRAYHHRGEWFKYDRNAQVWQSVISQFSLPL